jgi:hypothetical protein
LGLFLRYIENLITDCQSEFSAQRNESPHTMNAELANREYRWKDSGLMGNRRRGFLRKSDVENGVIQICGICRNEPAMQKCSDAT